VRAAARAKGKERHLRRRPVELGKDCAVVSLEDGANLGVEVREGELPRRLVVVVVAGLRGGGRVGWRVFVVVVVVRVAELAEAAGAR